MKLLLILLIFLVSTQCNWVLYYEDFKGNF